MSAFGHDSAGIIATAACAKGPSANGTRAVTLGTTARLSRTRRTLDRTELGSLTGTNHRTMSSTQGRTGVLDTVEFAVRGLGRPWRHPEGRRLRKLERSRRLTRKLVQKCPKPGPVAAAVDRDVGGRL